MDQFLEKVMNFINENTMLLIIICIFLIVILVIYLIDNTIKSKRLEQEELLKKNSPDPKVLENEIPTTQTVETPAPVVEQNEEVVEPKGDSFEEENSTETYVESKEETITPVADEVKETEVVPVPELVAEEPVVEVKEEPKSKYNNDKKLSDIFAKKEEPEEKKIETTQDFSDELDRILQKLNNEESKIDENVLDESSDYTNMF